MIHVGISPNNNQKGDQVDRFGVDLLNTRPVALFSDEEAVFYPDVARFLQATDRRFECVGKSLFTTGELDRFCVLIIPGGHTFKLLDNLGEASRQCIRSFVENGGGYIGICMGAYVASEIGLVKSLAIRVSGEYDVELNVVRPDHPVMKGYTGKVGMSYQNGPEMIPAERDIPLAVFPNHRAAIVAGSLGEGRVVLFSPHPERSASNWAMIENALDYSKKQSV